MNAEDATVSISSPISDQSNNPMNRTFRFDLDDMERYDVEPRLLESRFDKNFKWINLRPHPKETKDNRFYTKSGWITLNENVTMSSFIFPLYHSEVYVIGKEPGTDYILPFVDDLSCILIRVDSGKFRRTKCLTCGSKIYSTIIFENVSSPTAFEKLFVNGFPLSANSKICITGCYHADIEFDSFVFSLTRSVAPNFDFNSIIIDSVQCPRCKHLMQDGRPFPCGHVYCMRCIKVLSKKASIKVTSYLRRTQEIDQSVLKQMSDVLCPLCKLSDVAVEGIPFSEITNIPSFPILQSLENVIPYLVSTDVFCDDCDNVRCVASRNDFWKCTDCDNIVCPLCVVELHRHHFVQSIYVIMIESMSRYRLKKYESVVQCRQMYQITNKIEIMESLLNLCSLELQKSMDAIDRIVQMAKKKCNKLINLRDKREFETERDERRQLFEAVVVTSQQSLDSLLENFDMKVAIVNNAEMDVVLRPIEIVPEE